MKAFVISLQKSEDRRTSMEVQLQRAGIDYQIIDAVDGSRLTNEEVSRLVHHEAFAASPRWLNRTAIGCAASHLLCYKAIISQGLSQALILEDDMIFDVCLRDLLSSIELISLDPLSVVLLYYRSDPNHTTNLRTVLQGLGPQRLSLVAPLNPSDILSCAGAYILSNDACQSLLRSNAPIRFTADSWMSYLHFGALKNLYAVYPRICSGAEFDSTIEYAKAYYPPCLRRARDMISHLPIGILKKLRRRSLERRMSNFVIDSNPFFISPPPISFVLNPSTWPLGRGCFLRLGGGIFW